MFKRLAVSFVLFAVSIYSGPRYNTIVTVAAGTPVQIATIPTLCNRVFIQALIGGTGAIYIMDMSGYVAGTVPSHSTAGNLTAQLAPASSTAPGGSYYDVVSPAPGSGAIDLSYIWLDGSHTGDTVAVSYDFRN